MKILMLGWELPPHNSGGLGIACYQLCKALSRKGADIEFVLPYTADHKIDFMRINAAHPQDVQRVLKAGIAYDSFKYITHDGEVKWVDLFGQVAIYEEAVERIVQLAAFDVIHAHDWLTCRGAIRAKMLTGSPLIVHFHSIEADRAGKPHGGNPLVREIEELAMLTADRVVAVSQHTKDAIVREYGIPADKIEVVHNYSDPSGLIPADGQANAYTYLEAMKQHGYSVITSVGRLTLQKGLPNLFRAFQKVLTQAPKTFLLIVGSGEQRNELIGLSAELGIASNVLFADFQRGKNCRDAYTVADLFVMPSVSEPFGLVALEAIGYGTPVLISHQSGVSEMIRNALKVDFWDIDEMANKMTAIIQNEPLRQELHANAHREYMGYSWDDSADKLLDVYSQQLIGAAA